MDSNADSNVASKSFTSSPPERTMTSVTPASSILPTRNSSTASQLASVARPPTSSPTDAPTTRHQPSSKLSVTPSTHRSVTPKTLVTATSAKAPAVAPTLAQSNPREVPGVPRIVTLGAEASIKTTPGPSREPPPPAEPAEMAEESVDNEDIYITHHEGENPLVYFAAAKHPLLTKKHIKKTYNKYTQVKKKKEDYPDENEDEEDLPLEEEMEKPYSFTGFFSDGGRRVDLVLVVTETANQTAETMKTTFLANLVKLGLELEFDQGWLPHHRNLVFVKIHASDKVLVEFGDAFSVKKLFKDKHLQFMKPKLNAINSLFLFDHEREWIKLVRRNYQPPLFYSNLERSEIVFMLLLHQPFGSSYNHVSLNRLLYHNIILDAYALHDGPYFFMIAQDFENIHARQILFYNWLGLPNLLIHQPMNLIYEYFGSKIAFYFVFYEFYLRGLLIASVGGLLTFALQYLFGKNTYHDIMQELCCITGLAYCMMDICPECNNFAMCPFKKGAHYCSTVSVINYFDNIYTVVYCVLLSFGAALFLIYWRRYEDYWSWMWELCHPPHPPTVRPEFSVNHVNPRRSTDTGIMKYYDDMLTWLTRMFVVKTAMALCALTILATFFYSVYQQYKIRYRYRESLAEYNLRYVNYYVLGMYGSAIMPLLIVAEEVCKLIAYHVTRVENHRTYESFESSVVQKVFVISAMSTFIPLVYSAWLKGVFYTLPHKNWYPKITISFLEWNYTFPFDRFGTFIHYNCGPFGCYDELLVMLLLTIGFRIVVLPLIPAFFPLRTDYNLEKMILLTTPTWEREYQLKPLTDKTMTDCFNTIVLQFAIMTLFVAACPLAPIVGLLVGMWHLRFKARIFLLGSRRPVLFKVHDIGPWNNVLTFICYSIAFTNAVTIIRNTNVIYRYIYLKHGRPLDMIELLEFKLTNFATINYFLADDILNDTLDSFNVTIPKDCFFEGLYRVLNSNETTYKMLWPLHWSNVTFQPGDLLAEIGKWHKNLFDMIFIIGFQSLVMGMLLLMRYYMPSVSKQLKEIKQCELNLKRIHAMNVQAGNKPIVIQELVEDELSLDNVDTDKEKTKI